VLIIFQDHHVEADFAQSPQGDKFDHNLKTS
jgi:hypothetical protein